MRGRREAGEKETDEETEGERDRDRGRDRERRTSGQPGGERISRQEGRGVRTRAKR